MRQSWVRQAAAAVVPMLIASAHADETSGLFSKEYVAEITRHLYRWHLDETVLRSVEDRTDILFHARRLNPPLDPGDESRFYELLAPRIGLRVVLKQADYTVPELDIRVRNETPKIVQVGWHEEMGSVESDYETFRFSREEILDHLFRTRNRREFPDEELLERLREAVRDHVRAAGEEIAAGEGPHTVYIAPISPVSNELWVFWENARRLVRFTSDADMATPAYWAYEKLGVRVFDLDHDVVLSLAEVPGSNAYVTRDWAARVLFNCVVLGQKSILTPKD